MTIKSIVLTIFILVSLETCWSKEGYFVPRSNVEKHVPQEAEARIRPYFDLGSLLGGT